MKTPLGNKFVCQRCRKLAHLNFGPTSAMLGRLRLEPGWQMLPSSAQRCLVSNIATSGNDVLLSAVCCCCFCVVPQGDSWRALFYLWRRTPLPPSPLLTCTRMVNVQSARRIFAFNVCVCVWVCVGGLLGPRSPMQWKQ